MLLSIRPKSPPNSPNNELATGDEELKDIYINKVSAFSTHFGPNKCL